MIFVTLQSSHPPRVSKHTIFVDRHRSSSIVGAISRAMEKFRDENVFVFLQPGATIRQPTSLVAELMSMPDWDVAAYVHRNGISASTSFVAPFSGIGFVHTTTLAFRRDRSGAGAVLARWRERVALAGHLPEAQNLLIALAETGAKLLHLTPAYAWIEPVMRPGAPSVQPVVEHVLPGINPTFIPETPSVPTEPTIAPRPKPAVVVQSHFSQYTGYGKMAREVLFRLANTLAVRVDDSHKEPVLVERDLQVRIDAHKQTLVPHGSPFLRIMGPEDTTGRTGRRIVWTMQETSERVHPDMVARANRHWDEVWTPTHWNAEVFRDSGVKLPIKVMRLGVNPLIFRPASRKPFPRCRLISTSKRGSFESPKGFVFLTIGLPGFRKGWDVIAKAFEVVATKRKDADLVIGLTHAPDEWKRKVYKEFSGFRGRIWTLEGAFSDHELADVYRAAAVYVSASRGEGFNLPAAEAAACGLPVIVPENTCHPEIFGPDAYMFPCEGTKTYPEGDWISPWYVGQRFAKFGKRSVEALSGLMLNVWKFSDHGRLRTRIVRNFTWDAAAERAAERLLEVQP